MRYFLLHNSQSSAQRLVRKVSRLIGITDLSEVTDEDVVIRFNHTDGQDKGYWTINRAQALAEASSRQYVLNTLRRSGMYCPRKVGQGEGKVQLVRHYRIPVFNLKALSCFRTEEKAVWLARRIHSVVDSFDEVSQEIDEQARKACLLAVRAVHSLGLEFGLVSIGVNPYGRLIVLDISSEPVLKGRLLDIYIDAINDYINAQEQALQVSSKTVRIGADLEFMLRTRGDKIALASKYFPTAGVVGCDDRSLGGNRSRRPLAELRPEPASNPEQLLQNIAVAMRQATRMLPKAYPQWVAGSAPFERFAVGGHIHFSGTPFTGRLVNLLDVYVGLPLMLIEDPRTSARRRPKYGFLGDVRHKGYGGFEYRTPASFLVDPQLALGALALAYTCVIHQASMPYLPLHTKSLSKAFYSSDHDALLHLANQVHENISATSTYLVYQEAIDAIFEMIRNDEVWDESVDIRAAWDIPVVPHAGRRQVAAKAALMRSNR